MNKMYEQNELKIFMSRHRESCEDPSFSSEKVFHEFYNDFEEAAENIPDEHWEYAHINRHWICDVCGKAIIKYYDDETEGKIREYIEFEKRRVKE
jgi:hypothetical protein